MATAQEHDDINWRVGYHPPLTDDRVREHEHVRSAFGSLMHEMTDLLPPGREKSLVITNLEQAMFWANAAVARQHPQAGIAPSVKPWRDTPHGQV